MAEWLGWPRRFVALIKFPLLFVAVTSQVCKSPEIFIKGKKSEKLECPFPDQDVSWFRDDKPIINGTDDLYQIEEPLSDGNFRNKLFFSLVRMQHDGFYTCKANTSHNNTKSCKIQVIVLCKYCSFTNFHHEYQKNLKKSSPCSFEDHGKGRQFKHTQRKSLGGRGN